jgi:hypothetical protein
MCWYLLISLICSNGQHITISTVGYDYWGAAYFTKGGELFGGSVNEQQVQACGVNYRCTIDPTVRVREWWGEDDCEEWVKTK